MGHSVGRVASLAGVTVRTLHHYDELGLLTPGERTPAGHRRYSDADLDRLQRVLFYRELGFPLEEIALLLDDPTTDPLEHLRRQHRALTGRIEQLRKMAAAVQRTLEAQTMGVNLTPEEKFEVFGDHDPDLYEAEAEERWGGTEAYRQSRRCAASYTKEDWQRIMAEHDGLCRRLAALRESGEPADSVRAMDLAEEHRAWIGHHYECGYEMHRGLADMYVADERFTATYDAFGPGLATYLREAVHANADRRS
ncbi:MerR family transcriptional regulator [Streptomyces sp. XM4193]|uniref:MerR family transcriptional regulator n=1 Tax=Streptomyces sp. XM4193 TaxID=2929782 RepID=UPI001FFBA73B|nr:MerR family transcriptional regulator [Streptomyces sp. XM4193]MCK1798317.1 MerR family transcriptional regulator [Streptomyces sp. XM4193]